MEEEKEAEQQSAFGVSKKIIIIAVAALLLGVGVSAVTVFFLVDDSPTVASADAEKAAEAKNPQQKTLPPVRSLYYRFNRAFIVNIEGRKGQHHLMVDVTISSKRQQDLDALERHLPVIKNNLNQVFDGQEIYVLQTDGGRQTLNEDATAAVRSFLAKETGSPSEARVLFTGFVMQ